MSRISVFLFVLPLSALVALSVMVPMLFGDETSRESKARKDPYAWRSLFDGKTLDGWAERAPGSGGGEIKAEKGVLSLGMGAGITGINCVPEVEKELPKTDYEIRYEARREMGTDFFGSLTFPVGDSWCTWINGGWGGSTIGLSSIDNLDASENETGAFYGFRDWTWYRFRIRVTKENISVWIGLSEEDRKKDARPIDTAVEFRDGTWVEKQVVDFDTKDRKIGLRFEMDAFKGLAFCTWATTGELRNIEVRKLTPRETWDGIGDLPDETATEDKPRDTAKNAAKNGTGPVAAKMERAWEVVWERFYLPETKLFYDYLVSYEPGQGLKHLPTAEEVKRQYPNPQGYGTGMEDCMISAGVLLDMVADRFAVTEDESLRKRAREIFEGVRDCATVHGVPGFLARGICPEDGKSVYINSSRDQYTHAVHGLWVYYHSPLCDEATRKDVGKVIGSIADRMIANVVPENDYDSLRLDGSRDPRGINRMWKVAAHEAARLPMIYAAAWETTGDEKYRELYRKYLPEAVEQSFGVNGREATYALLQMQGSIELLRKLEKDPELQGKMDKILEKVALLCRGRLKNAVVRSENLDLTMLGTDWRNDGGGIIEKGPYRPVWYAIREVGEAALAQLMVGKEGFPEEQRQLFRQLIDRLDFDRVSTCGIYDLLGAYWKGRRLGLVSENE